MKKIIVSLMCFILAIAHIESLAAEPRMEISVGQIVADAETTVELPIQIKNNTGICGAILYVNYDKGLTLESVKNGTALSKLTMTAPGKINTNPIKILWDGTEEDYSDGEIVKLSFKTPKTTGVYNVSISYIEGDIIDGRLNNVMPQVSGGYVKIENGVPNFDTISDISLLADEVNLGWVVDGRKTIYDSVTLIPQLSNYFDLKGKVVWSIEGTKDEVKEAKKYLTLSNGKLTAKKNSAGKTVVVKAQLKGTDKCAKVIVNLIGERTATDVTETKLDSCVNTIDINIKGKGMGAAKPNPNTGILLPIRGITAAKANKVKWLTSDKTIATVSGTGKVTGKKEGTATITATLDGKKVDYKINVHTASIAFKQPKGYELKIGSKLNLSDEIDTLAGIDTDKKNIKWSVTKNQLKFGSVDANGVVTAVAKGTVNVTAEINGVTNKIKIKIVP